MVRKAFKDDGKDQSITGNELADQMAKDSMKLMNTHVESKQNPVRILANIILRTEPSNIMIEATRAIRNLSKT